MDDFYIHRNGWNVVMFHGGKIAPKRVLIFAHGVFEGQLKWSLRSPIDGERIASEDIGKISVSVIEAAAGAPIPIPDNLHDKSIDLPDWKEIAKLYALKNSGNFEPQIGTREQWKKY